MSEAAIICNDVGKRYWLPHLIEDGESPERSEEFWALRNVTFQVARGEIVGVVGSNGAGKTTLLKILSKVSTPTEGSVEVYGRLGSLLQVGAGFHPDLSGRDNVYLNGAILGMKRTQISSLFDEIVDFAEIARFIDMPIKKYSSGMTARLAFSIAAHLEPEILILDEILSVGDTHFQEKCRKKMEGVIRDGRTVLIVSHNLATLPDLCTKAILMAHGRLEFEGTVDEALSRYLSKPEYSRFDTIGMKLPEFDALSGGTAYPESTSGPWLKLQRYQDTTTLKLISLELSGKDGRPRNIFFDDEQILLRITLELLEDSTSFRCILQVQNQEGDGILASTSHSLDAEGLELQAGVAEILCILPPGTLWPRQYLIEVVLDNRGIERVTVKNALEFRVERRGHVHKGLPASWVRHPLQWDITLKERD